MNAKSLQPINIERAFDGNNIKFERHGQRARDELLCKPVVLDKQTEHLPTHKQHFYDVHRHTLEPGDSKELDTEEKTPHVLNLTAGSALRVGSEDLRVLESLVVPASIGKYTIENRTDKKQILLVVFLKQT